MSPLFRKKNILTQETLGEKLKHVRLGKNWSVQKAAEETRISKRYLTSLETARYDDLPGEVYIKNFIRSYSAKLGLNPDLCLELYNKEKHIIEHKKFRRCLNEIKTAPIFERLLKPRTLQLSIICLVAFCVLGYLGLSVYKTVALPALVIFSPANNIETRNFTIAVIGKSDPEARVIINNEEVLLAKDGSFSETIQLQEGLNLISATARGKHSRTRKIVRHILVNPDAVQPISYGLDIVKIKNIQNKQ